MAQIVHLQFRPAKPDISAKPDIWLTVAGWVWLAYASAIVAVIAALA